MNNIALRRHGHEIFSTRCGLTSLGGYWSGRPQRHRHTQIQLVPLIVGAYHNQVVRPYC